MKIHCVPEFHQLSHSSTSALLLFQPRQSTQCSYFHSVESVKIIQCCISFTTCTDYFDFPGKVDVDVCIAQKHILVADNGPHVHSSKLYMLT